MSDIPDGSSNNIFPINFINSKEVAKGVELYPQEVLIGGGPARERVDNGTGRIVSKVVPPNCLTAESAESA
eukprot:13000157-Heterocapsa_arctica.AAC.1